MVLVKGVLLDPNENPPPVGATAAGAVVLEVASVVVLLEIAPISTGVILEALPGIQSATIRVILLVMASN